MTPRLIRERRGHFASTPMGDMGTDTQATQHMQARADPQNTQITRWDTRTRGMRSTDT